MILDCKAEFHGDQDMVQVLVALSEDDAETSLHTALKTATAELLYWDTSIASANFTSQNWIPPQAEMESATGYFRLHFSHFVVKRETKIKVSVELKDGRKATIVREVGLFREEAHYENPMLAGRRDLEWLPHDQLDYNRNP